MADNQEKYTLWDLPDLFLPQTYLHVWFAQSYNALLPYGLRLRFI